MSDAVHFIHRILHAEFCSVIWTPTGTLLLFQRNPRGIKQEFAFESEKM